MKLKEASCVHGKIVLSCDQGLCCHLKATVSNAVEKTQKMSQIEFGNKLSQLPFAKNRFTDVCMTLTRSPLLFASVSTELQKEFQITVL